MLSGIVIIVSGGLVQDVLVPDNVPMPKLCLIDWDNAEDFLPSAERDKLSSLIDERLEHYTSVPFGGPDFEEIVTQSNTLNMRKARAALKLSIPEVVEECE